MDEYAPVIQGDEAMWCTNIPPWYREMRENDCLAATDTA